MRTRPRAGSRPGRATCAVVVLAGLVMACADSSADRPDADDPPAPAVSSAPPSPPTDDPLTTGVPAADAREAGDDLDEANHDDPGPTSPSISTVNESTTTSPEAPERCVEQLSVRDRAALLVWPAVYAEDWPGAIEIVRQHDVGGVLLMGQGELGPQDVAARLAELESASRHGLIIATDEEGGTVQRLRGLGTLSSQREVSDAFSAEQAADLIAAHGDTIRAAGIDMVLGPVIDVEPNVGEVPLDASRLFDGGPARVAEYGAAYLSGWERAGLFATVKHYPGHGAASGDTHITAGVTPSLADLRDFDLEPYIALADDVRRTDAAVMVGHLTVPGLTDGVPATRSPAAVSYLRDDLGYGDVLLMTDALGMAAVGVAEPEASVLAIAAGLDVVLFTMSSQTGAVIDALESAVETGRIDVAQLDAAARKVMRMLARDGHTCDVNRASSKAATVSETSSQDATAPCDAADGTLVTPSGRRITLRPARVDGAAPTLMVMHGFTGTPAGIERVADLTDEANATGLAVAYPEGTPVSPGGFGWNSGAAVFATSGIDDVTAIAEMIDAIVATGCVDPGRITLTGESNGGGMTLAALCDPSLADVFRSAVMVVPAVDRGVLDRCNRRGGGTTPLAVAVGAIDTTTPLDGGNGLLGQRDWFEEVAEWRDCTDVVRRPPLSATVDTVAGVGCDACTELFVVADGPHTWPGTRVGNAGSTPGTFDLNRRIIADASAPAAGCLSER